MRSPTRDRADLRRRRRRILPSAWRRRPLLTTAVVLLAASALLWRRAPSPAVSGDDYTRYHGKTFRVARVIDGDTVDLAVPDGRKTYTRVRLWGVDTPEVEGSPQGEMYFGPRASRFSKEALEGMQVETLLVRGETRGVYGRLLAYLRLPGQEETFNERLIETGHAYADWRFDHPLRERFLKAERRARQEQRGLWQAVKPQQMPKWRRKAAR